MVATVNVTPGHRQQSHITNLYPLPPATTVRPLATLEATV